MSCHLVEGTEVARLMRQHYFVLQYWLYVLYFCMQHPFCRQAVALEDTQQHYYSALELLLFEVFYT